MTLANIRSYITKYFFIESANQLTNRELQELREIGVDGFIFNEKVGLKEIADMKEKINKLPDKKNKGTTKNNDRISFSVENVDKKEFFKGYPVGMGIVSYRCFTFLFPFTRALHNFIRFLIHRELPERNVFNFFDGCIQKCNPKMDPKLQSKNGFKKTDRKTDSKMIQFFF